MTAAGIVLAVVLGVAVFVIAAWAIGREARRLDAIAPRAVYIVEEAAVYVADTLPAASQARLTHAEVEGLLLAHLRWLHAKGLQPDGVVDLPQQFTDQPVVMEDTTAIGYLIGVADQAKLDVDDADIANVVDAHLAYFGLIGAIGSEAADPDVPMRELGRGPGGNGVGPGHDARELADPDNR